MSPAKGKTRNNTVKELGKADRRTKGQVKVNRVKVVKPKGLRVGDDKIVFVHPGAATTDFVADPCPCKNEDDDMAISTVPDGKSTELVTCSCGEQYLRSPTRGSIEERPTKRQKLIMDFVELPILRRANKLIKTEEGVKKEELKKEPDLIVNVKKSDDSKVKVKVKVKKGTTVKMLSDESIRSRISAIGFEVFPVKLDRTFVEETVSRAFMSNVFGGNCQQTFPDIGEEHLARHGLDDFMYLTLDHHPHAPQVPGAPGLFLSAGWSSREDNHWPTIQRYIVRISSKTPAIWQYQGQYKMIPSKPLTTEEWSSQRPECRALWMKKIYNDGWGRKIMARIWLRKSKGHQPTFQEVEAELEKYPNKDYRSIITVAEVDQAFLCGEESIGVYAMKCVGYDEKFQMEIVTKKKTWARKPKAKKTTKQKEEGEEPSGNSLTASPVPNVKGRGRKRKAEEV